MASIRVDMSGGPLREIVCDTLRSAGHEPVEADPAALWIVEGKRIASIAEAPFDFGAALRTGEAPLIVVGGRDDGLTARYALRAGALDFLLLPEEIDKLGPAIERGLRRHTILEQQAEIARVASDYRRQARRWEIAARVAEAVASSRDYGPILNAFRVAVAGEIGCDVGAFVEVKEGEGVVVSSFRDGAPPLPLDLRVRQPGLLYEPLSTSRTTVIDDLRRSPIVSDQSLADAGFRSAVTVPVLSGGELVGLLLVGRSEPEPFASSDVELLETIGGHLAHAITNVQAHVQESEVATLKERLSQLLVHDLKNPLSIIKVDVNLLRESDDLEAGERMEILDEALAATDRLLAMIGDLLEIGRAEDGRLTVQPIETSLSSLFEEVGRRHRRTAQARGITLAVDSSASIDAKIDRNLFMRVLENIINNSLRYTPPRGVIRLGCSNDGRRTLLFVENNGPSIPIRLRSRLFSKYGSIDSSHNTPSGEPRYGARGLGLYLCRLVVEAHDGTIDVGDREGGGVRFEIALPRLAAVKTA